MKNRRMELGGQIKLSRVVKPAPPQFTDWLGKAAVDGSRFAPNFLELHPREVYRAMQLQMDAYKSLCRQNTAVCNAVMSAFHYSLAQTILVNPDEESWLTRKGLLSSIESQNRMVQALLGLIGDDRKTLLRLCKYTDFDPVDWTFHYQGSMAVARFAQAAIRCGVSVRFANAYHDINRKIDLFCEPPFDGSPTLCVQVKSHGNRRGCEFSILTSAPDRTALSQEDFRILNGVWRGVQNFNQWYKRDWTPVLVRVGFVGTSITQVYDEQLEKDISAFFKGPAICRHGEKLHPFDCSFYSKHACA